MEFNYKRVLIFGYGRSGKSVEHVLQQIKTDYCIYDKKIKIDGGCFLIKLNRKILSQFDLIVISPGVSIFNKHLRHAESMGIKVISELEFGFWFTNADVIAVTGTNGKTTTVNLINKMLNLAGYKSMAYGNVGIPLSSAFGKKLDYIVCEVSSFQLEATDKFLPFISILLNVESDHIDRHKNFKNYYDCKKALFKNCKNEDYIITNYDDANCRKISNEISGNIKYFSKNQEQDIFYKNDKIYLNNEVFLKVENNIPVENLMAVCGVADILDIESEIVEKTFENEKLLHRQELVLKHKGITYINDSKATNIHAVKNAIEKFGGHIILLMGGSDKKLDFNDFFATLHNSDITFIFFGEARNKLYKIAKKHSLNYYLEKTCKDAINLAYKMAGKGDTVLFSPACASFDEFNNYEERGEFFKESILKLVKENGKN